MYDRTFFYIQLSVRENLTVVFKQLVLFYDDKGLENLLAKGCPASIGFL